MWCLLSPVDKWTPIRDIQRAWWCPWTLIMIIAREWWWMSDDSPGGAWERERCWRALWYLWTAIFLFDGWLLFNQELNPSIFNCQGSFIKTPGLKPSVVLWLVYGRVDVVWKWVIGICVLISILSHGTLLWSYSLQTLGSMARDHYIYVLLFKYILFYM